MGNIPIKLVRALWFLVCCVVGAIMLVQLPTNAGNAGLVFVVMWVMLSPLLKIAEGEHRFTHLGRGLLGGVAVWLLGAFKKGTFSGEPNTLMMFFTIGVLVFAAVGSIVESRRARDLQKQAPGSGT